MKGKCRGYGSIGGLPHILKKKGDGTTMRKEDFPKEQPGDFERDLYEDIKKVNGK